MADTPRQGMLACVLVSLLLTLAVSALAGQAEPPDPQEARPNNAVIAGLIDQLGSGEFTERRTCQSTAR